MNLCVVPDIDRKRLLEKEKLDRSSRLRLRSKRFQRLDKTLPLFIRFRKCPVNRLNHDSRVNRTFVSPCDKRRSKDVRQAVQKQGIIALDNGVYKIWFARNYKATAPNTVLLDNALATMGAGLPSAMAAKLVHSDRQVMAICGDGGFMMNS